MEKQSQGEQLKAKLFKRKHNRWDSQVGDLERVFAFAEDYKKALDYGKTERRFVDLAVQGLTAAGFQDISKFKRLKAGDRVFLTMHDKSLLAAVIGSKGPREGWQIVGSHVDSPRLDLKPNPLLEDTELVYFKTHYYGGIKKYQWLSTALAIHGVIYLADGTKQEINIGEAEDDPVFTITDLLPHLDKHLRDKKMTEFVDPEKMNLLIGSIPYPEKDLSDRFKLAVLAILHDRYGIKEADFNRAEIEVVPAQKARDVGLDRSLIGAYGQDDRVCAYTSLRALSEVEAPDRTAAILLVDKEEIGSEGNTGAQSSAFQYKLNLLHEMILGREPGQAEIADFYLNTNLLSSDVCNAYDPSYAEVSDPLNSCYINCGIGLNKYTGAGGKVSTNDSHAEFLTYVTSLFDQADVPYQICELGKVDWGGGGTIAKYFAKTGMNVVDSGVGVLAMHSCFEVTAKLDVYNAYRAYRTFLEEA